MNDPIPWYESKVLRGLMVAVVTYALSLMGIADRFPDASGYVDNALKLLEFGALAYSAWHRVRSPTPPVTLTKDGAPLTKSPQLHPLTAVLSLLMMVALVGPLSGCAALGISKAQTVEQKAAAALGDFSLYQKASLQIGNDPSVVPNVRRAVLDAAIAAKPAADSLDIALRDYRTMKRQLDAGETTQDRVAIAAANLQDWVGKLTPLVSQLRQLTEGVNQK